MLSRPRPARGFTLIELLVALAIGATLVAIAYPGFADQLHKARRTDAIVRLGLVQQAQERWRANQREYGSLSDLKLPATTADGLYRLSVTDASGEGYVAGAQATGAQARDLSCRFLRLTVSSGDVRHASGPDDRVANPPALNRRCWNQ